MKTRTAIYSGAIVLLLLALWVGTKGHTVEEKGPVKKIEGGDQMQYVVPPMVISPLGSNPQNAFDWMGQGDCHCDVLTRSSVTVIDSVTYSQRAPSYSFVQSLPQIPGMPEINRPGYTPADIPPPIVWRAPEPMFWFIWDQNGYRIATNDGLFLPTYYPNWPKGMKRADGYVPNSLNPLEAFSYLGRTYKRDWSKPRAFDKMDGTNGAGVWGIVF